MDTRPYPERKGHSGSRLLIETTDRDFAAKPRVRVDDALRASLGRLGVEALGRGNRGARLILSGEIRHFHGQIQLTRLPDEKMTATSSFLPANYHASVQLLATLFDVERQRVLFRQSFFATRDERRSINETTSREAKRQLVALVEECLEEVARAVAEKTASHTSARVGHGDDRRRTGFQAVERRDASSAR